jgi:hypothetical protein
MILELLTEPVLRNRLGAAAAETAQQYTWERNVALMRELFEKAKRQNSRP